MKQLYLAPRSNESAYKNFASTLSEGREYREIEPYLNDKEKEILNSSQKIFVWGNQANKITSWNSMSPGDVVLFYAHYNFVAAGIVQFTKYSPDLALALWPASRDTGEPWSNLFFVKDIRPTSLPISEFNSYSGYSMEYVRGFMRVSEVHLTKLLNRFGTLDDFLSTITSGLHDYEIASLRNLASSEVIQPKDIELIDKVFSGRNVEEVIEEYSARNTDKSPDTVLYQSRRIKRDYSLVKALKDKYENKCQVCGFTFTTSLGTKYSEAAHIKPISSGEKGVDVAENILILCPNHHKMLDFGKIKINKGDDSKSVIDQLKDIDRSEIEMNRKRF